MARPLRKAGPVEDTLRKMRAYILAHGWTQNVAENYKGQVCLIGACRRVQFAGEKRSSTYDFIRNRKSFKDSRSSGIGDFNDAPTMSYEGIMKYLDEWIRAAHRKEA